MPVLLPEDEVEIAEPFGCKTIDEVVYVLHFDSREQLLRELSSTDPHAMAMLMTRIDFARMEEKVGIASDAAYPASSTTASQGVSEVTKVHEEVLTKAPAEVQ